MGQYTSLHAKGMNSFLGQTIRKVMGGGGGEAQKQGKLSEENLGTQSRPGKKFLHWPSTHFAQIARRQAGLRQLCWGNLMITPYLLRHIIHAESHFTPIFTNYLAKTKDT